MPCGERRNSAVPTACSSSLMAVVMADCEIASSIAAWETCPSSAVATKYRICRKLIVTAIAPIWFFDIALLN